MTGTVIACSLAWISGNTGWSGFGRVAAVLCVVLVSLGYWLDLETSTVWWRLRDSERAHKQTCRRLARERFERVRAEHLADNYETRIKFWIRVAYGVENRPDQEPTVVEQLNYPVCIGLSEERWN